MSTNAKSYIKKKKKKKEEDPTRETNAPLL
jgi:hypothetical protein